MLHKNQVIGMPKSESKARVARTRKWRERNYRYIQEVKSLSECEKCGEARSVCLDFHHKDPDSKRFSIAEGTCFSIAVLDKEIKKCIVICSNCHRVLHASERLSDIVRKRDIKYGSTA